MTAVIVVAAVQLILRKLDSQLVQNRYMNTTVMCADVS